MAIFIVLATVLMCVTVSVNFADGSTVSVRRVVNVGDDLTLNCVTDCNPNITLLWYQTKLGSSRPTYIASAGPRNEKGHISPPFHNKLRFSYSYENGFGGEQTIGLALHISNILEEDSADYSCHSYDTSSLQTEYLYAYDISAISCRCSVGLNVVCVLGFNVNNNSSVSLKVDGVTVTEILKNNRLEFSTRLLNESSYDHSIKIFSPDDILSNITCTLPIQLSSFPEDTTNMVYSTTADTLPTDAMSTFFFKDPQSPTERMTTFSSSQSNTSSRQGTTTVLPSQSNTPSRQRTTTVLPSSKANAPPRQRTTTVLPSQSHTPSRQRTTTVLPSQSNTPSKQRTTMVFSSQSNTSKQRTTAVSSTTSNHSSSQRMTSVFPAHSNPSHTQTTISQDLPSTRGTTTVHPNTQPNPSPETSSEDYSSILPNKTTRISAISRSLPTTDIEQTENAFETTTSVLTNTLVTNTTTNGKDISESSSTIVLVFSFCISLLAGAVIIVTVVVLIKFRSKFCINHGNEAKLRNVRGNATGRRLQTLSTTIPDFTFHNNEVKTCRLNEGDLKLDSSHFYAPILDPTSEQGLSLTDKIEGMNNISSDFGCVPSGKGLPQNTIHKEDVTTPEKELRCNHELDISATRVYFELENEQESHLTQDRFPSPPCSEIQIQEFPYQEAAIHRQEVPGAVFGNNILYNSTNGVVGEPLKETSPSKASPTRMYFVLEDNPSKTYSSDNPSPILCSSDPLRDSDDRLSGHCYEDIDILMTKL